MKKLIALMAALIPMAVAAQGFVLKGKIGQLDPPAYAYLVYDLHGQRNQDSAKLVNGEFAFKGTLTEPVRAALYVSHDGKGFARENYWHWDQLGFYLEKGTIEITAADSVKYAAVSGGEMNAESKTYHDMLAAADRQLAEFNRSVSAAPDSVQRQKKWQDKMLARQASLEAAKKDVPLLYVKAHPQALFSLVALQEYAGKAPDLAVIQPLFDALAPAVRQSPNGRAFAALLQDTGIGGIAPDFTQADTGDKPVRLSTYRGKYVLLDFWASWCVPCRGENPNVVKAYAAYHHRNFEILGVSLDRNRAAWLNAVHADGLTWTQLSDLKYWGNQVARLYSISGVPANFLIDPNGKIIARNLRGDDLQKKLDEVLPK